MVEYGETGLDGVIKDAMAALPGGDMRNLGPRYRRVFDSIVVITDRRVLDRQLQSTIRQFEQTLGVVENIDTTSRQLKEALEAGKTIIVTTLQKFPVIAAEIGELPGRRFALIIDEAHSSQSGESTKSLKAQPRAGYGAGWRGRGTVGRHRL